MGLPGYNEPFPSRDAIVKRSRRSTDVFTRWNEQALLERVSRTPFRVQSSEMLEDVGASTSGSIATEQAGGLYRVSVYREVTTADPVSSSLACVLAWTHNGKAMTRTLTAFAGAPQTTASNVGDSSVIEIDAGTPISYTLTYASNTPALARFEVTLMAELLEVEA